MSDWYDTSGPVAERTNTVIAGLLDWAEKTGHTKVKRKNIEEAVRSLTPVDGEDTVDEYVKRVVTHGPFQPDGTAIWRIEGENSSEVGTQ